MKTARALTAALGLAAVLLLIAGPAGAHGGEGEAEVTSVTRSGDDVTVVARLIYVDDGHGVPDATVTVVVDDGTAVPMEPGAEEGDYQATVAAPPGATIRVTSVEPATSVEATAPDAEEAAPTTEGPTTSAAETTTTAAAEDDDDGSSAPTTEATGSLEPEEDDGTSLVVIGAIVAVVAAAGVMAAVLLWKRPGGPTDADETHGAP